MQKRIHLGLLLLLLLSSSSSSLLKQSINAAILHRRKHASNAPIPLAIHQPGIQRTLRDHGYGLVYHAICMFISPAFARYIYQSSLHRGQAQAEYRPECLVLRRGGLPVQRLPPMHLGTNRA